MKDLKGRFSDAARCLRDLWEAGWQEVGGTGPLRLELAGQAFEAGFVRIFTDDTDNPHCSGVWTPSPSFFTEKTSALVLSVYIRPEYRGGRLLLRILRHLKEEAGKCGCGEIIFTVPRQMSVHGVFRKLCGEPSEILYRMEI